MKELNFQLKNMCKQIKQGSFISRSNRHNILQKSARQLHELGFNLKSSHSLKPKHIEALLARWKEQGLSCGTLRNRLTHIRWWARQIGKAGIVKKSNAEYGISAREKIYTHRAFLLSEDKLHMVEDARVRLALHLQSEFGLRKEEAIKLRPSIAIEGGNLVLKASWTKGGRKRVIPILTEHQRDLLDYVQSIVGTGSLIPTGKTYIQFVNRYYAQIKKAGITNPHGLRHAYAQRRYTEITNGMRPPALGGKKRGDMDNRERLKDRVAREIISNELGHNRLEVTNIYLGGAR